MNVERLLALYERIADAPDAVERLRRFVLDLAVRGRLVAQDGRDEPAGALLKRIADEKRQRNIADKRRVVEVTAVPPPGWSHVCLGDYALDVYTGPFGSALHQSDYVAGGIPLVNPSHMVDDRIVPDARVSVSADTAERLKSYRLESGDIVMARRGEVGRAALVGAEQDGWLCGTGSFFLRFSAETSRRFLLLVFHSDSFRTFLAGRAVGTTMVNLNHGILRAAPILVPPLAEQHRIVAKVDELMALCDRLEAARVEREMTRDRLAAASLARLNAPDPGTLCDDARFALDALPAFTTRPDQIKQLRQTILNLAVRGKLVQQDPRDEPINVLLERIEEDKALRSTTKLGKLSAIRMISEDAFPYLCPIGWAFVRFGDIVVSRDGERIPVSKEERNGRAKVFDYYGASGVIDKIDSYLFDKPLLLIGEDGANLVNRSTPIAFIARGKYWVNNHAHVLDGLSEGFLRYLELFINATDLKPYVTGTAQPKMNQAKMNSIPVALPPLPEQHRIVAKVDELMALCDQLEASLAQGDTARRRLLDALLAAALAPDDEGTSAGRKPELADA